MNKMFMLFLVGILLLLHSCTVETKKMSLDRLFVDPDCEVKDLRMSDLYSDLKYIRLETSSESLISQVYKIIPLVDRFLVVDRDLGKIFVFGLEGKFISTIGRKGAGPEEFIGISDVTIDSSNDKIYVLDNSQLLIHVYGIDGSYHKRIPIDFVAHEFEYLDKDMLVLYCDYSTNEKYSRNGKRPNVFLMDISENEIIPDVYIPDEIAVGEVSSTFSSLSGMNGDGVVLSDVLTNRLLFVGRQGTENVMTIDFGEQAEVDKYIEQLKREQLLATDILPGSSKSQQYTVLLSCLPTEDYCMLNAMNYSTGDVFQMAYSLESGKCLLGKAKRKVPIANDIDNYPPFIPYSSTDDCILGIIEPYMILNEDYTKDLMKGLKEDDNPIVVVAKTKQI